MIIIGITGTAGSGKGTVVEYLQVKYGFKHYSARGFIVEELDRRDLEHTRDNMRVVANELRATHGASFVAENLYDRAMSAGGNAVMESLRAVGEVTALRAKPGKFYLWATDADPKVRYERIKARKSSTDFISFEEFMVQEQKEMADTSEGGMQIGQCIAMADAKFINEGSIKDLQAEIDAAIAPLLK